MLPWLACRQGGYSDVYVPFCGLAVVEELTGIKTEVRASPHPCRGLGFRGKSNVDMAGVA